MKHSLLKVLVALAGSVFIAGCGGQAAPSDTSAAGYEVEATSGLTKSQLIAKGDAICEKTDAEQEAALKKYLQGHPNATSSPAGQAKAVEAAGLPQIRTELERLEGLGAPPGEEAQVRGILKAFTKALEEGEAKPTSLLGGASNPFEGPGKRAAKYGFKACSRAI